MKKTIKQIFHDCNHRKYIKGKQIIQVNPFTNLHHSQFTHSGIIFILSNENAIFSICCNIEYEEGKLNFPLAKEKWEI